MQILKFVVDEDGMILGLLHPKLLALRQAVLERIAASPSRAKLVDQLDEWIAKTKPAPRRQKGKAQSDIDDDIPF